MEAARQGLRRHPHGIKDTRAAAEAKARPRASTATDGRAQADAHEEMNAQTQVRIRIHLEYLLLLIFMTWMKHRPMTRTTINGANEAIISQRLKPYHSNPLRDGSLMWN